MLSAHAQASRSRIHRSLIVVGQRLAMGAPWLALAAAPRQDISPVSTRAQETSWTCVRKQLARNPRPRILGQPQGGVAKW